MEPLARENILLVDDQPAKLLTYEIILESLGETLLKADSGRAALELLLKNEVAVVLIDVSMPELDGFQLASMIRAHPRFETTAIIFVSAVHLTDLDRLRGYNAGAVDYVPVPVSPELLRAKVRVFADLYRKTRQLERLNTELEQRVAERTAALEAMNALLERRVEERTREREQALAQVAEMQKLESLGQLTGGVAHDFNNLLTVILGNLALLRKRLPVDANMMRLIDHAIQAGERGAALTARLLAFARRQDLHLESLDLADLVSGVVEILMPPLGPLIQVTTDIDPNAGAIEADRNQLELALLNLALNARDAMPLGGRLTISGRCAAEDLPPELAPGRRYVRLTVTDTGTGMDEATVKRATEPFFTTKGSGQGSGLGLSMVHGLIAQSHGSMRIISRVGHGTAVELWFPASARGDRRPPPPMRSSNASCRVLLIDDDPLVLASTAAMLEDVGHAVFQCTSGAEALRRLRSGLQVELIITDYAMPGMNGIELATQIGHERPDLPILLATAYAELGGSIAARFPRVAKPYDSAALTAKIDTLVAGRGSSNVVPITQARSSS
jgi:signal transduction histidine kinase